MNGKHHMEGARNIFAIFTLKVKGNTQGIRKKENSEPCWEKRKCIFPAGERPVISRDNVICEASCKRH